ncbi:cilia- and flagella-associated protein 54 isoform X1 [Anguilla anguilla]|uniref:cilia- and flagella-associated protein 54 isoform X1 n=1 Tax=Anguilla anguilla TaxID=7936 RepID=UPI0015B16CFC|nr:cilia- and flagella-associated protein 54 isoform X1 [Anguilla anguilla]
MDSVPATHYGKTHEKDPVVTVFNNEIKEFKLFMKKVVTSPNFDQTSYAKGSKILFEIWNKYNDRLPACCFEERVLRTADFLSDVKLYRLAIQQGYGRYLQQYCSAGIEEIRDVGQFNSTFFPQGFGTERTGLTLHALQGLSLCSFLLERSGGEQWDQSRVQRLQHILSFLRIMMQALLPHESLCWILYNGSLQIYNICRFLMSLNLCSQALEYLVWACVCLETSVPLMSPSFLAWRTTLYCAACQCYYSCQAGVQAEVFARRALGKVSELAKLAEMSSSPTSTQTQEAFKEATIKLAVMVFKRSVYEPRRRPKGLFRPRLKSNLKEAKTTPWPRSPTERALMGLFEGGAARFLALTEALWDGSLRPLQTGGPEEPEMQEVALELLSAGISILAGAGEVSNEQSLPAHISGIAPHPTSLLDLAKAGDNRVSVEAAVKFAKLLFRYEQWDAFARLSSALLTLLQGREPEPEPWRRAALELTLLMAMEPLLGPQRLRHSPRDSSADGGRERERQQVMSVSEEMLELVETLHSTVCGSAQHLCGQDVQPDRDLVLDIVQFLWLRCKAVFQRAQAGHWDSSRSQDRLENYAKWVQVLSVLSEVAHTCELGLSDPVAVAEMTLRLAAILEGGADALLKSGKKTASSEDASLISASSILQCDVPPVFKRPRAEQLRAVWEVVERGVEGVSRSRARLLAHERTATRDSAHLQSGVVESEGGASGRRKPQDTSSITSLIMDLHLELLAVQHRVFLKLLDACPDRPPPDRTGRNGVSRAVLLMQEALLTREKDRGSPAPKDLLEDAARLMEKAQEEERRLANGGAWRAETGRAAPPPILLSRTHRSMSFAPAPYAPGKQVCWYALYGREATGVSPKARLGDCHLLGTGEEVPAPGGCVLRVEGLEPNRKYVFAVAAYDAQGKLVGGSVGESTAPLLASLPLPLPTAWAHLAQAAYRTGHYVLAKKACGKLWDYITQGPLPETRAGGSSEGLAQTRLKEEALAHASPILQQLLLTSIFIATDIRIQEGALYCDALINGGSPVWGQEARLAECERMLVAVDLALRLKEESAALQGVVGCYGLLSPLIYHQIPSESGVQVLLKCLAVLLEIPGVLRHKRPAASAEPLLHMLACITFYLAKVLRTCGEPHLASAVIDQGKSLLLEVTEGVATQAGAIKPLPGGQDVAPGERPQKKTGWGLEDEEPSAQLRALEAGVLENAPAATAQPQGTGVQDLTGQEDFILVYGLVCTRPPQTAFRDVMKMKRRAFFLELAVPLLQRALREDRLEHVLEWGQGVLSWLCRRDEGMTGLKKISTTELRGQGGAEDESKKYTSSVIEYNKKTKTSTATAADRKRKDRHQRKQTGLLKPELTEREIEALDVLLTLLPPLLRRAQRRRRLRRVCADERPGRCHVNLGVALSHMILLRRNLEQRLPSAGQHRYSRLDPSLFSLAHCGVVVSRGGAPQGSGDPQLPPPSAKPTLPPSLGAPPQQDGEKGKNSSGEESSQTGSEEESDADTPRTQLTNEQGPGGPSLLCATPTGASPSHFIQTLDKALLHFRRAMVLAHRGGLWTSLQWVCRVLWDHASAVASLVEQGHAPLSPEQLDSALTPLLALATDLLMDMMHRLQMWKLFESGAEPGAEPEAAGGGAGPDPAWLRALALRGLELLARREKWESLAHLALLFNRVTRESYSQAGRVFNRLLGGCSRESYSQTVTPLLLHAQRRLRDRIVRLGGPPVPQPHFTRTEAVAGEKVTCRNYGDVQLLLTGGLPKTTAETSESQRAQVLVCVPLDVTDTLRTFRETLGRRPYVLQTLQHSETLLLLLLANTQTRFGVPSCLAGQSQGRVGFRPAAIAPPDLSEEDFSSLDSVYHCTLPPSQLQAVISSYTSSIEYLEANKQNSLRVQALHDLGNLHYYCGNKRAAQTHWSRALDCALQCTGVLGSWDGASWGSAPPREALRQAGVWGCLQGAVLSAKIAQFVLTSDLSQRTHCSLLSARLFKLVLTASLPHPEADWQYCAYELGSELIPGLDLFSSPARVHAGATASSLAFLCHWLYGSGHYLKVLPLLSLYLYLVGTVCGDPDRTAEGRILRVQVLTELGFYGDAMRELASLRPGERTPQPHGTFICTEHTAKKIFDTGKPLLDPSNLQAVEELVSGGQGSELPALYRPLLVWRLTLARAQLILALCQTIPHFPEPQETGDPEGPAQETPADPGSPAGENKGRPPSSEPQPPPASSPAERPTEPPRQPPDPTRGALTPVTLKASLLDEAARVLTSVLQSLRSAGGGVEELELAVETRLLLSAVYLEQGKCACSADLAVSALQLLQDTHDQDGKPHPTDWLATLSTTQARVIEADPSDVPQAVEARERLSRALWLRCRLALLRALVAHIPGTAIHPGVDSSTEAARLLAEGLQEAEAWGDPDTRALLLHQGVLLHTHRGRPREDITSQLQEAVGLLSGCRSLSPGSSLTLATSALQLSDLRRTGNHSLLLLTQELLQQQLCDLGESVLVGEDCRVLLTATPGLKNIYLPQLPLLARATMRLGQQVALQAKSQPGTDGSQWLSAQKVLDSALQIARATVARDFDLETDILYCKGLVERSLASLRLLKPQAASETFLHIVSVTPPHSHTLQLIRSCYLEMASLYMLQWEQSSCSTQDQQSPAPPCTPKQQKSAGWQRARVTLDRALTERELQLLHCWVCVRAANQVSGAHTERTQLCGVTAAPGGPLQPPDVRNLPSLATGDLLASCGGAESARNLCGSSPLPGTAGSQCSEITWVHLARYHGHILNLHSIATHPVPDSVEGLCSVAMGNSLTLRLAQLHTLFSSLLPSYRGRCCPPKPPTVLLQPHGTQSRAREESFPWACADEQQLCLQWHWPALDLSQENQNTVVLLFALNQAPVSALRPAPVSLSQLRCGRRRLSRDRLNALHAELCSLCAEAYVSSPNPGPKPSRAPEKEAPLDPLLQERSRQCCGQISTLLQVTKEAAAISEVPFEPSLRNLRDLERCFNPGGGASLSGGAVVQWLASLLL